MKYCQKCGHQVSDEVQVCPFCNQQFEQPSFNQARTCMNCGAQLPPNYVACPYCGCPIDGKISYSPIPYPQPIIQEKSHKGLWAVVITALVIIVALVGWIVYDKVKEKEEKIDEVLEYYDNLGSFYNEIAKSGDKAEDASILILKVWRNTIYKTEDSETDKYTRKSGGKGEFYEDFNDSLKNLFSDSSFKNEIESIENYQKNVDKLYKKLKNPPDKYKDAYETAKLLYSAYNDLCMCATNPSGNYKSAMEKHNTADDACAKYMKELYSYYDGEE